MSGSPWTCTLENHCCSLSFKAKSEKGTEKNTLSGGYRNLAAHFLLVGLGIALCVKQPIIYLFKKLGWLLIIFFH